MAGTRWRHLWSHLWPQPEPEGTVNPPAIFLTYANALPRMRGVADDALRARLVDLAGQLYRSELERRRHTEARSTATLSAAGITFAFAGGLLGLFAKEVMTVPTFWKIAIVACHSAALVYLVGALRAALQVYGPSPINIVDPLDLAPIAGETDAAYAERYGYRLIEYTIANYKENNRILQSVFTCQRRLQYAIGLLFAAVLLFVAVLLFAARFSGASPGSATLL